MNSKKNQSIIFSLYNKEKQSIDKSLHVELCKYMKKNKISFKDLYDKCADLSDFFYSNTYQTYYESELQLKWQWINDFADVKRIWDENAIEYIFHKSIGDFPYQSDNLDLLVQSKDFKKAGELLKKIGYIDLRNIQEEHKEFYRKFDLTLPKGPIHLHERICWGVPYDNIEHIWKNKQISDIEEGVFFLDPSDIIITQSIHCFIEDHIIKAKDLLYLKETIENNKVDWNYIIQTGTKNHFIHALYTSFVIFEFIHNFYFKNPLFPRAVIDSAEDFIDKKYWIRRIITKIKSNYPILPLKTPHLWARMHSAKRIIDDNSFGTLFNRYCIVLGSLFDGFLHLKLKWHNQPGFHITFSGCDGCGKTTYIKNLVSNFNDCGIKTKVLWHRVGSMFVSKIILKLRRNFNNNSKTNNSLKTNNEKIENSFILFIWRQIYYIDMIIYNLKLSYYLHRNYVIISDRYIYDDIIDLESTNIKSRYDRVGYKILRWIISKPNLAFYIDTPPDIIEKRTQGSIVENISENYLMYNKIMDKSVSIIDNSNDIHDTFNKVSQYCITQYFNQFSQKYKDYKIQSFRYK